MRFLFAAVGCFALLGPGLAVATSTLEAGGGLGVGTLQPSLAMNYLVNLGGDADDLGEVGLFAGNFAPTGWARADGQLLDTSLHAALFAKLGTTYGGDGVTTFALPDLRGRTPIGAGQGPGLPSYALGQAVGSESAPLADLPAHSHAVGSVYTTQNTGSATPHSNLQPSLALTPIIATQGIFPSHSLIALDDPAPLGTGGQPFLGEMTWLAHDTPPAGWTKAEGQLLPIAQHNSLYALLGTQYGGDGQVTFALPDLRGRTPVGQGQGPGLPARPVGAQFGSHQETLSQLPSHTHDLPHGLGSTTATGTGTSQSHLQPSLALTYLIAMQGVFPPQSLTAGTDPAAEDAEPTAELAALGTGFSAYLGSVSMFAGNYAIRGFAETEGQAVAISDHSALFSLVYDSAAGSTYYGGNFPSDFKLPDLRGRAAIGMGSGTGLTPRTIGEVLGSASSPVTLAQLPSHSHPIATLGGDFDLDGDVDGSDFLRWQRGQSPAPLSQLNLLQWQAGFGAPLAAPSTAVPEPATAVLLALAALLCSPARVVRSIGC